MIFLNYLLIRPKCIGRQIDGRRVLVTVTEPMNKSLNTVSTFTSRSISDCAPEHHPDPKGFT